ncbi:MAG TPA: DUF3179 domain-containing (seleno)protein [Tepidisphaeraceae bacterium]|nr:DUF3179 domain-containing (seleno)protein [Tepidisphaeraceae bacterium]
MLAPLAFILFAIITAGVMAYGTHPDLARYAHGVEVICAVRQLQWPLATASVVFCMAVVALVVMGRRRAWWLIGLAPVVSLFAHTFAIGPMQRFAIADEPHFVEAADTAFINDDDYVVGLTFAERPLAFPYAALFNAPVVVQTDRELRLLLLWNPYANAASAMLVNRTIRAAELDLVSMPANALLVYNRRNGQFINGITGLTDDGKTPSGVRSVVATQKMPWRQWRALHPNTRVMLPSLATGPAQPLLSAYPLPTAMDDEPDALVTIVHGAQPVALVETPSLTTVANFSAGGTAVLFLPESITGQPVAFDRRVKEDLFPAFNLVTPDERRGQMLIDADSGSLWTLDGQAASGPLKGERLERLAIDTELNYRVAKFWYPALTLVTPEPPPRIELPGNEPVTAPTRQRRRTRQ